MAQDNITPESEPSLSNDHLDQIAEKYAGLFEEAPAEETPAVEVEAGAAPEAQARAPEDQPPTTVEGTAPTTGNSAQILALARREAALRAKEKEYETSFETKVRAAVDAEIAKLRDAAVRNPAGFYKQIGVEDFRPVANDLYYNIMGDEAPLEFKTRQMEHRVMSEVERANKRAEEAERRAQEAIAQYELKTYVSGLRGYVSGATPDTLPYLKAEFEADPNATVDAMVTAASNLAQSGTVPTAQQVAEALNAELAKIADRYVKAAAPRQEAQSNQPTSTRTLTNVTPKSRGVEGEFDVEAARRRAEQIFNASRTRDR